MTTPYDPAKRREAYLRRQAAQAERVQQLAAARAAFGLCRCGAAADDGHATCTNCRRRRKEKREQLKAAGICQSCMTGHTANGIGVCDRCKESRRAQGKQRRHQRRSSGVCYYCNNLTVGHSAYCEKHFFQKAASRYLGKRSGWKRLRAIWKQQEGRCVYTGVQLALGVNAEPEHRFPVARGGRGVTKNLQWVLAAVNRMKRAMLEEEFLAAVKAIYEHRRLGEQEA